MLDKYTFFSRQEKEYYENLVDIGEALGGMAKQTVSDCVRKLKELGLIEVYVKKVYATDKSITSNSYVVKDIYGIYAPAVVAPIIDDSPF
jgi:DNA-binding transcriptional regulator GbsR (MarR family)